MENKEKNMIVQLIGILGVIFCLVSLLTPWSASVFTFGYFGADYSAPFYIDFLTNQTIHQSAVSNQVAFFAIVMVVIFILILSALLLGIFGVSRVNSEHPTTYLLISALLIVPVILYITAVSIFSGGITYTGFAYGAGFATAIIAFVIFFIVYVLQSVFHQKIVAIQKIKSEDDAMNILKSRYAKGEITKEKYEQMKKDLDK